MNGKCESQRHRMKQCTMAEFHQSFQHFPEYKIIVCKQCQYAIIPAYVGGHLKASHPKIPRQVQQRMVIAANNIEDVAHRPEQVQYPPPETAPVEGLPVFIDGYQCQWKDDLGRQCSYTCRGQTSWWMQWHCQKEHSWKNCQGQGGRKGERQKETPNRMWIQGQHCQRFFKTGKWQRYFVVQSEPPEEPRVESDREAIADAIFTQYEAGIKEAIASRGVEDDTSRFVPNAWLTFTGWAGHLSKFQDKEQIKAYIQSADDEEGECAEGDIGLENACRGTRRLIRAAFKVCNPNIVGKTALESANRRETGAESNERPFYAGHQVKTIRKYSDSWVSIQRYIWRTAHQKEKPKYHITQRQLECLERLQEVAAPDFSVEREESRVPNGMMRKEERRQAIEDACMMFWIAMFDHELKDSEFKSGIVSGLAVLGIDTQTGSWKTALNYTPILSAIVTVMRALVVYRSWQMRQQSIQKEIEGGSTQEEAEDRARSVVEGVDKLVERFMTLRKFGGRISPMDRILHMRTYGLKIRMTTKAGGTVSWEGDSILVNKIKFNMDDIRIVVQGLYETVRKRLNDLLYVEREDQLPALDLKSVCDNAAELSEGWNFLKDSRNEFTVDGERWMWRRMFVEEAIERSFIVGGLDHVQSRDDIQWDRKKVEDYFRKVRRFKEELQALVHFAAGAPARATSLISIQTENGPQGRGQRGIFIENGMVDIVTAYDKGTSMSQKVKIIHRYVPREVGEMIVRSMWLLDPWVKQLQGMS